MADLDDDAGGRFSAVAEKSVIGSSPGSHYPKMDGGPWAKDELPPEPLIDGSGESDRLGYRIDGQPSTPAASGIEGKGSGLEPPQSTTQQSKGFRRRV
jgi:hypothetical protein